MTHLVTLTAILILHITARQLHRMSASCCHQAPALATLNTRSCGVQTWRPKLQPLSEQTMNPPLGNIPALLCNTSSSMNTAKYD